MRRFAVLVIGLRLAVSALAAAEVVGTVHIAAAPLPERNRQDYGPGDASEVQEDVSPAHLIEELVVYLEGATAGSGPHPRPVIVQRDKTFVPRVLPIRVGAVVQFPNEDSLFHNVFSLSKAKSFDLGKYPTGESRSQKFDRTGVVKVFCEIHSRMKAVILVLDTDAFTTPDRRGEFRLTGVPPGAWTLVVYHPLLELKRIPLQVRESGAHVDIQL